MENYQKVHERFGDGFDQWNQPQVRSYLAWTMDVCGSVRTDQVQSQSPPNTEQSSIFTWKTVGWRAPILIYLKVRWASIRKILRNLCLNSIICRNNDISNDDIKLDSLVIRMYTLLVSKVHKSEFYEWESDCVLFQYKKE